MNNIDPSGLAVQLGIGIILVLPTAGQVCEAVVAIIGLIVGSTLTDDENRKKLCPEGYSKAKENCYATTPVNSESRNKCFASAYNRCVKGTSQ